MGVDTDVVAGALDLLNKLGQRLCLHAFHGTAAVIVPLVGVQLEVVGEATVHVNARLAVAVDQFAAAVDVVGGAAPGAVVGVAVIQTVGVDTAQDVNRPVVVRDQRQVTFEQFIQVVCQIHQLLAVPAEVVLKAVHGEGQYHNVFTAADLIVFQRVLPGAAGAVGQLADYGGLQSKGLAVGGKHQLGQHGGKLCPCDIAVGVYRAVLVRTAQNPRPIEADYRRPVGGIAVEIRQRIHIVAQAVFLGRQASVQKLNHLAPGGGTFIIAVVRGENAQIFGSGDNVGVPFIRAGFRHGHAVIGGAYPHSGGKSLGQTQIGLRAVGAVAHTLNNAQLLLHGHIGIVPAVFGHVRKGADRVFCGHGKYVHAAAGQGDAGTQLRLHQSAEHFSVFRPGDAVAGTESAEPVTADQNPGAVQRQNFVVVGVGFVHVRQAVHAADLCQLAVGQSVVQNGGGVVPSGGSGIVFRLCQKQPVAPGKAHIGGIPCLARLGGLVSGKTEVGFVYTNGQRQGFRRRNAGLRRKLSVALSGHQPQSLSIGHIGIEPVGFLNV